MSWYLEVNLQDGWNRFGPFNSQNEAYLAMENWPETTFQDYRVVPA